jgi:hypothetical protein
MTGNGSKTLRRYRLTGERDEWLADVVIADDGYFSTVSDYGDYAYWWSSAGECFRSFLAQIDADYLLSKVSRREYDGEATESAVKRHIIKLRREGRLSREAARAEWGTLAENDHVSCRDSFTLWLHGLNSTELDEAYFLGKQSYPTEARMFGERVLPVLQKVLREELAREKAQMAPLWDRIGKIDRMLDELEKKAGM